LADQIVNLTEKSYDILQIQMTIHFEMKYISFEWYNKLFNASHALFVFERHNSIETSTYPGFSCSNNAACWLKQVPLSKEVRLQLHQNQFSAPFYAHES